MQNLFKFFNPDKDYFMLKEILEQELILKKLAKRFFDEKLNIKEIDIPKKKFSKIFICASGTSKNAGEIIKYQLEKLLKIPTIVEFSSEFAHKEICITKQDLFIAISQSGNTGDSFEALKIAKDTGALTIAVTNNPESKIHKYADHSIYIDAGVENSIAATKSFSAQLFILYAIAIYLAEKVNHVDCKDLKEHLIAIHSFYKPIFEQRNKIEKIAKKSKAAKSIVILARGINSAVTLEGSLKLKETCYIDANGYPMGEFLHGYMAFLDGKIPAIAIITAKKDNANNYSLALNNLKKIKAERHATLIIIKDFDDAEIEKTFSDADFINVSTTIEPLTPFLNVAVLQLFSYELALALNLNVDKPRSLTKCVDSE